MYNLKFNFLYTKMKPLQTTRTTKDNLDQRAQNLLLLGENASKKDLRPPIIRRVKSPQPSIVQSKMPVFFLDVM